MPSARSRRDYNSGRYELPNGFEPNNYTVMCGRGKDCFDAIGNRRLRVIVGWYTQKYSAAPKKLDKSHIVKEVVSIVRGAGGAFAKFDDGKWYDVGEPMAKEKVSFFFREALATNYRSSGKSKIAGRRAKKLLKEVKRYHGHQQGSEHENEYQDEEEQPEDEEEEEEREMNERSPSPSEDVAEGPSPEVVVSNVPVVGQAYDEQEEGDDEDEDDNDSTQTLVQARSLISLRESGGKPSPPTSAKCGKQSLERGHSHSSGPPDMTRVSLPTPQQVTSDEGNVHEHGSAATQYMHEDSDDEELPITQQARILASLRESSDLPKDLSDHYQKPAQPQVIPPAVVQPNVVQGFFVPQQQLALLPWANLNLVVPGAAAVPTVDRSFAGKDEKRKDAPSDSASDHASGKKTKSEPHGEYGKSIHHQQQQPPQQQGAGGITYGGPVIILQMVTNDGSLQNRSDSKSTASAGNYVSCVPMQFVTMSVPSAHTAMAATQPAQAREVALSRGINSIPGLNLIANAATAVATEAATTTTAEVSSNVQRDMLQYSETQGALSFVPPKKQSEERLDYEDDASAVALREGLEYK